MKPRPTRTSYAILGLLSLAPMSGYGLRKEVASSIGYFWSESYGQIYPALRELSAKGWIRRHAAQSKRPEGARRRHVYEITEPGRRALKAWRGAPPREGPARNELLLKLFFGRKDALAHEQQWIDELEAAERDALRAFSKIRAQIRKEHREHPSLPFWIMTLSYGEHRSRSVVRWCRETRRALAAMGGRSPREEP